MRRCSRIARALTAAGCVATGAAALWCWWRGAAPAGTRPSVLEPVTATVGPLLNLTDVTSRSGFEFVYDNGRAAGHRVILEVVGGGLGTFDYDGDGRWDLFCPGGGEFGAQDEEHPLPPSITRPSISGLPSALFRNLGDWKFVRVTEQAGIGQAPFYTHGCSAADFNGDGFTDLLVTGYGGLQLFQNQGDGRFIEVRRRSCLLDDSWSTSAAWGDLDGDGHLDLYVTHYVDWSFAEGHNPRCADPTHDMPDICPPRRFNPLPDIVYFSNGDGTFRDVTTTAGMIVGPLVCGKGLGVVTGDVDLDGDLDIYVANDTDPNFLYINQGPGLFKEVAPLHGAAYDATGKPEGSMGVDLGDFNGDCLPDIWVTNFEQESNALYRNDGRAEFRYVSLGTGIAALGGRYVGFGTALGDVDRDGDEDFVVSNGHVYNFPQIAPIKQEALVLINNHGHFVKASFPPGGYFSTPHRGRGLAMSDFDDDGDLDFAFSHNDGEPNALVSNEIANDAGWLRVRLIGTASNRDAIGAWLVLHTSAGHQVRLVKGGGSYLSQSDLRPFWGIPAGTWIKGLTVHWPKGRVQKLDAFAANQTLVVIESPGAD